MKISDIHKVLKNMCQYGNIYVPEFTYKNLRIDASIIDTRHRWIRGFEIKTNRGDFLKDRKWTQYSKFCSSLSIVCPEGLIEPHEIGDPFGLLWIYNSLSVVWKKKPKNFQKRNSLSWLWTYVEVLELEMSRISLQAVALSHEIDRLVESMNMKVGK